MKVLFFGAGPLGSVYAHLVGTSGGDVTILDRGERATWLERNGIVVSNDITGQRETSRPRVIRGLQPEDEYDLVIVLIRKNRLPEVCQALAASPGIKHILFMGNNALGFDEYLKYLPVEKVLFGFPGAGGGIRGQIVHYADRERPGRKRQPVTIGEVDGKIRERTRAIKALFETAGVPVDLTSDIDGWLKYHVALVSPLVGALYKHDCDPRAVARDKETLRAVIRAVKEGGEVLRALGFRKSQPFTFHLLRWLPESLSIMPLKALLESQFAEVAFAMHAKAAVDEMTTLADEFEQLAAGTSVATSNIDALRRFV